MASYPDLASESLPLPVSPRSSAGQASAAFTKATPSGRSKGPSALAMLRLTCVPRSLLCFITSHAGSAGPHPSRDVYEVWPAVRWDMLLPASPLPAWGGGSSRPPAALADPSYQRVVALARESPAAAAAPAPSALRSAAARNGGSSARIRLCTSYS